MEQLSPLFSSALESRLAKSEGELAPSLAKPTSKPEAKPGEVSLEKLMKAIAKKESGGNHQIINSDSGASGKWQIMPANIPSWSRAALGREVSHAEFMRSPQLQYQIAKHRLNLYLNRESQLGRTQEEIIRRVASAWYSGQPSLWKNTRPQFSNGRQYPSIAQYTLSVWRHYIDAKSPSLLEQTKQVIASWSEQFQREPSSGDIIAGYTVTSPRGWRTIKGKTQFHQGVDLGTPVNTPLYAIADGWVECKQSDAAGKVASFSSDLFPALEFKLLHLSKCVAKPGSKLQVKQGEVIGWTGNTGFSTGAHLDLRIKYQVTGKWLRVRAGWLYWFVTGEKPLSPPN